MEARDSLTRMLGRVRRALGSAWSGMLGFPLVRHLRPIQLRRLRPLANGRQRGTPVVRFYWERFVEANGADIRGRCLEVGSTHTIRRLGGSRITHVEALDLSPHHQDVKVVADLSRADHVPADAYDCFINPFTTHLIYDIEAALYHSVRILKPGGVLLANFPCVDYYFARGLDMGTGRPLHMFWWFTPIQVENLLRRAGLTTGDFQMTVDGNLFTRVAYQMNMPCEELTRTELTYVDDGHPLLISVRAVKPAKWCAERPAYRDPWLPQGTPSRWNPKTGHYPDRWEGR